MDEQLTLHELRRLEAQRKLQTIPRLILDTAWVREAQVEAVIDAVLASLVGGDAQAYVHARHVGQWCERIAEALPFGPNPSFARRVGLLAEVDPETLERICELKHVAASVRDYQAAAILGAREHQTMSTIVIVAEEFESRIAPRSDGTSDSASAVFKCMLERAPQGHLPAVAALGRALRVSPDARVA